VTHVEPPQPAAGLASSSVPPAPIAWPPGVTAAACLTFDMDAEAPMLTADISRSRSYPRMPTGSPGLTDVTAMAWEDTR
jgi:hypothetical protein